MNSRDLLLALLLPLPPWLGYLLYRYRGRVGLAYGYFLGGALGVLSLPWPLIGGKGLPSAHLGGTLFGFTLFLQAHREGRHGLRSLTLGVGGASLFVWVLGGQMGLDMRSVAAFWGTALLEGALWLLLSDLGYRATRGRWLALRMPLAGGLAFLVATALYRFLPLGAAALSWPASLLAGVLLGLVALQQLLWMRAQGIWVEGRGDRLKVALSALEGDLPPEGPALAYVIEARQPMLLVNEKGTLLETNTALSRRVGMPRHQMTGFRLQDLFQGTDSAPWEELREQLLKDSRGSVQATLVRRDASFQSVTLEAVPFDRNMALVWIADPQAGTLGLRTASASGGPAAAPEAGLESPAPGAQVPSAPFMKAAGARTLHMLGPRHRAILPQQPDLPLQVEEAALGRMVDHLLLQGRQEVTEGTLTLVLTPLTLDGRAWARLEVIPQGPPAGVAPEPLGLSWLEETVRESRGLLERIQEPQGAPRLRIYLPCGPGEARAAGALPGARAASTGEPR